MTNRTYVHVYAVHPHDRDFSYKIINGIKVKDKEKLLDKSNFKLKNGDRVYFMPGCTIPRFKIRDMLKHHGAAICKRIEDATVIVGGPETINAYTKYVYYAFLEVNNFLNWLSLVHPRPSSRIKDMIADIREIDAPHVLFSVALVHEIERWNPIFEREPDWFMDRMEKMQQADENYDKEEDPQNPLVRNHLFTAFEDNSIAVKFIQGQLKVVDQEPFLKIINNNSVSIDRQMFEELRVMLKSPETANTLLAMEVMANANYDKSFLYLALLLKEFGAKIGEMHERNHVNFKALLNYIGLKDYAGGKITIDNVIAAMATKKLLTKSTLAEIMPIVQEELATSEVNSENFRNDIVPTDHLKNQLTEESDNVEIVDEPQEPLEIQHKMINPDFEL